MTRRRCNGIGQAAVQGQDPDAWPYPHCPVCGREFGAAGRAGRRYDGAWKSVPIHYEPGPPDALPERVT